MGKKEKMGVKVKNLHSKGRCRLHHFHTKSSCVDER